MCGRFTLRTPASDLAQRFELDALPEIPPRYNIAPTQPVMTIRSTPEERSASLLRWGLIPSWARDTSMSSRMINARSETVHQKPAFRKAFAQRRCLIIADGFFEWQGQGRQKQPFSIALHSGEAFAFAGLWETWQAPDGSVLESCTILTTEPNERIKPIHDRMPVILDPDAYACWLDPAEHKPQRLLPLLQPYPADAMDVYPVHPYVNNTRHQDARCIAPMTL
ncbi:MAG: SOS response-associated peptidase [Chloroflexaceae bacterium]|nr:SOS response-associated peptidase [Chloroflexaceae bacterium]